LRREITSFDIKGTYLAEDGTFAVAVTAVGKTVHWHHTDPDPHVGAIRYPRNRGLTFSNC